MKTQNTNFLQALGKAEMVKLTTEVKETVAVNAPVIRHKAVFGAADLWNLERTRRTRIVRRHFA